MGKQYLTAISPASVEKGRIPFNLYAREASGRMVLFCKAGLTLTAHHVATMSKRDRAYFIGSDDTETYLEYAFKRIDAILENRDIRVGDKADIVHGIGKRTVRELLENPNNKRYFAQAEKVVGNYISLMTASEEAADHLFALSATDAYTFSHSINVCTFSLLLGERMFGRSREGLQELGMGALLHDIGKTRVDESILFKPEELTPDELEEVRRHTTYGYDILKEQGFGRDILAAARSHHERLDGSGYPDGLRESQIPLPVRIVAVADVYDAITSTKVYRKEKPHLKALVEMAGEAKGFDKEVFEALLEVVLRSDALIDGFRSRHLVGSWVESIEE